MPNYLLKSPETNQEWEAYLLFRWEILRKPLGMSKESLADAIEEESFHLGMTTWCVISFHTNIIESVI